MITPAGTTYSTALASITRSYSALEQAIGGLAGDPVRSYVDYRSAMTQFEASLIVLRRAFEMDRAMVNIFDTPAARGPLRQL